MTALIRKQLLFLFSALALLLLIPRGISFALPQTSERYFVKLYDVADWAYVLLDNTGGSSEHTPENIQNLFDNSITAASLIRGSGRSEFEFEITPLLNPGRHHLRLILWDYPKRSTVGDPNNSSVGLVLRKNEDILYEGYFKRPSQAPSYGCSVTVFDQTLPFDVEGVVPNIRAASVNLIQTGNAVNAPNTFQVTGMGEDELEVESGHWAITLDLDPGTMEGDKADYWVVMIGPDGESWSFVWYPEKSVMGWMKGLKAITAPVGRNDGFIAFTTFAQASNERSWFQTPLFNLGTDTIDAGLYTFVFAVDDKPNGEPDGTIWYDTVTINMEKGNNPAPLEPWYSPDDNLPPASGEPGSNDIKDEK